MDTETLIPKWIAALRSGIYPQANGFLRTQEGYCCLGVLCDLVDRSKWEADGGFFIYDCDHKWLPNYIMQDIPANIDTFVLADMNDKGESFCKIADLIENKWQEWLDDIKPL